MTSPTNQRKSELLTQASVRKARISDFDSVVSGIGDVYGGRDWLPAKFHEFLDDTDIAAYVIELDGHGVIGFYMAQYLDGGLTLLKRNGRIHPDFRGQGLFQYLGEFLTRDAKTRRSVTRELMVALNDNSPRVQKLDYKMINILDLHYLTVTFSDLPSINPMEFSDVHKMTWSDMEVFFDSPETWNKLLPTGFLFVESLPLRRYKSNIKRLLNHRTDCFMSFETDEEQNDDTQNITTKSDVGLSVCNVKNLSMISIGHHFQVRKGLAYNISLFSDNFDNLLSHIKYHISNMELYGKDVIYLLVTVDDNKKECVTGQLKTIFRHFRFQVTSDDKDYIFEKSF